MRAATLDLETFGNGHDGILLCLGWDGKVYRADEVPDHVWEELADPAIAKVTHTDYDHLWLKKHDIEVNGPHIDTRVLAWMVDENSEDFSLGGLIPKYLDVDPDKRLKRVGNSVKFQTDDGRLIPLEDFALSLEHGGLELEWAELLFYCERDIVYTQRLAEVLLGILKRHNLYDLWKKTEVPFSEVLVEMQSNGLPIDLDEAKSLVARFHEEAQEQESALHADIGYSFNLGSWQQLMEVLYEKVWYQGERIEHGLDLRKPGWVNDRYEVLKTLGEPVTKKALTEDNAAFEAWKQDQVASVTPRGFEVQKVTPQAIAGVWTRKGLGLKRPRKHKNAKTEAATDSKVLRKNFPDNDFVLDLLAWRKKAKAASYIDSYFDFTHQGRLYGQFNRCGTVTGRLSASNPNLMNIPSRGPMGAAIRGLFKGPGLIVGDHSQLEVRLLAHFSQDPRLLDIYRNGKDIYCEVGSTIFGHKVEKGTVERDIVAKTVVLGDQYGAGPDGLQTQLFVLAHMVGAELDRSAYDLDRMRELQNELHSFFHVATDWKQRVIDQARDTGYVMTIGGRVRRIDQSQRRTWRNDFTTREDRQAVNSIIQGSAADILQKNMLDIHRQVPEVRLLCQVHDELVLQVKDYMLPHLADAEAHLKHLQGLCEAPGWVLNCPLRFVPALVDTWAEKG